MGEININIEGFNVNGICVGCLNYNRKMAFSQEAKLCYKILANIDVPDGLTIKMCWECLSIIKRIVRFRDEIKKSFDILLAYSKKQSFLNSPSDLSKHAIQRFSVKTLETFSEALTKEEPSIDDEIKNEIEKTDKYSEIEILPDVQANDGNLEIKEEIEDSLSDNMQYSLEDSQHIQSSEDDMVLSQFKTEDARVRKKEKKKVGRKKEKRKTDKLKGKTRKLKNLPESLVELHTMDVEEMWTVRQSDSANESFQKLKYKCENCLIGFNTQKLMDVHINGKHNPGGKYKCENCLIGFNTQKLMDVHINGKHNPKSENDYQCNICKAYFLTKENIKMHRKLHLSAYRCRECSFTTTMKKIMLAHDCARNFDPGYACPDCPEKVFSTKSKLVYHRSVAHQEKPQCDCCGKVFANKMTLKYHLKILPQNKEDKPKEKLFIPCKGCDKVFHSKKSYRAHVVIHDGLTYPCPICGKLFQWKRNLARHTKNHRDREAGATHQCRECRKVFSSRDCYNNHMRFSKRHAHENSYIHACHFCGKKFATRWCMNDHIDWEHLKTIKYQCSICFKPFKTAKIMVAHVNNIHEGKNKKEPEGEHLCEVCGKSYKTVKRLKGHVWAMHTNRSEAKTFKCPLCPATFSWQTSIYKHIKMMHYTRRPKPRIAAKKPDTYPGIELAHRMQYFQQNIANNLTQPPANIELHN